MSEIIDNAEWVSCESRLPPNGEVVLTKVDDERGSRNEQQLKRQGALWFFPDYSMYVYYTPTHWMRTGVNAVARDAES